MESVELNLYKKRFNILLAFLAVLAALLVLGKTPSITLLAFLLPITLAALYLGRRAAKSEVSLHASENKFRVLFESTNDCLIVLDLGGRIEDINQAGYERLGYTKAEMVGNSVSQFDAPGFAAMSKSMLSGIQESGDAVFESALLRKEGSVMPIEARARVVELDGVRKILCSVRDLSDHKRADSALREHETQYRAVIDTSADGFWITDLQGRILEVNDAYVRMSGYSREELLNMRISDVEAAERPEETAAHLDKVFNEKHDRFESSHRAKNGRIYPVEVVVSYWPIGDGRLFVFVVDITRRILMERFTLESDKRYRFLFENLLDAFVLFKLSKKDGQIQDFTCVEVNEAFKRITGLKDTVGKTGRELIPGIREDNPEFFEAASRVAQGGPPERFESYLKGLGKWLDISVYSPEQDYIVILFDNISGRKRSEQMISTRLDFLTRQANDVIYLTDWNGQFVDVNNRAIEVYGYTAEEFSCLNIERLLASESALPFEKIRKQLEQMETMRFDSVHVRKDGSNFPVEVSLRRIEIEEKIFVQSLVRDISERKLAEQMLSDRERKLAEAQRLAKIGSWEWDATNGAVHWSDELYRIFRLDPAQPLPPLEEHVIFFTPSSRMVYEVALEQTQHTEQVVECDLQLATQDGAHRWVFARFEPLRDTDGRAIGIRSTVQDISERKRQEVVMEEAVREIADLYNNAPCGYHSLNADGYFVAINNTELSWLGYRRNELIGKVRLPDLLATESIPVYRETFPKLKQDGATRDIELKLVCKDGRMLPVLISATAIKDKNGKFLMSRSTVYDMTDRKRMEEEREQNARRMQKLSQRMVAAQELDRRWLANELHDRSGANLAALMLNYKHITSKLPPPVLSDVADVLEDTQALLVDTSANIREVCANLRPVVLDLGGFWQALEGYASQFSRRTGIAVHLDRHNGEPHFSPNVKSTLFRITQEALTNSAKHARASDIHINLGAGGDSTVLTISDNGLGFDPDEFAQPGHAPGLGLITMQERAEFIGGKFSYETAPGWGMHIRVEFSPNPGLDA